MDIEMSIVPCATRERAVRKIGMTVAILALLAAPLTAQAGTVSRAYESSESMIWYEPWPIPCKSIYIGYQECDDDYQVTISAATVSARVVMPESEPEGWPTFGTPDYLGMYYSDLFAPNVALRSSWGDAPLRAYGSGAEDCTGTLETVAEYTNLAIDYPMDATLGGGAVWPWFTAGNAYGENAMPNAAVYPIQKCIRVNLTLSVRTPNYADDITVFLNGAQQPRRLRAGARIVRYIRWRGWENGTAYATGRLSGNRVRLKAYRVRKCNGRYKYTRVTVAGKIYRGAC